MTDYATVSHDLTLQVRAVDGIKSVFLARPVLEAAVAAVAERLDLREPDHLVRVDDTAGLTTVTVHVGTMTSRPTPEILAEVAAAMRDAAVLLPDVDPERLLIDVKARVIETV